MIDVLSEDLIDLRDACRERPFRKNGKACHISTMYRLLLRGARAADGSRVKLETVRTPIGLKTSREAIVRFFDSLTNPESTPPMPRTAIRKKQMADAEAELAAAGFQI